MILTKDGDQEGSRDTAQADKVNTSETTTVISNEHLERSALSNFSNQSGSRYSVKSFNSTNDDKQSIGNGSACRTYRQSNDKYNSLEF